MTDRVADEDASIEDIRLGIMEDLINRFLAQEIDVRQLTDYVTISRLQYEWTPKYSGTWLRELTYHHLFMHQRGTWSESTLRESLSFLLYEAIEGNGDWRSPMIEKQWRDLLKAGHTPPGVSYHAHTEESIQRMTPGERRALRKRLGMG